MNPIFRVEPCPFCGCNGRFKMALMRFRGLMCERVFVGCPRCKITRHFESVGVALGWWNKRTPGK